MPEQLRCLNCGHTWRLRGENLTKIQCPRCRRHRVLDNQVFETAVIDLVHLLRKPSKDPLADFAQALDHAKEIIEETIVKPLLAGQAAFELMREALGRLGFPRPSKISSAAIKSGTRKKRKARMGNLKGSL